MIRAIYSVLLWLAQPLLMRKLRQRAVQEPGYGEAVGERLGRYSTGWPDSLKRAAPTIWVHAVSLGETRAAAGLIAQLRSRLPHMRLLLTHGTATGRAEGAKLLRAGDAQVWLPWDTPAAVARFLTHFKPTLGLLMETEVWPNLVHACQQRKVPLVLANARLSHKSLQESLRLAWLARPAYQALTAVWPQTQDHAARFKLLGAPVSAVLGNIKFDAAPNAALLTLGRVWRSGLGKPVLMLAVSRQGEEAALLDILLEAKQETRKESLEEKSTIAPVFAQELAIKNIVNDFQWLIVPRHPQRFDEVAALILQRGFGVSRRSTWGNAGPMVDEPNAAGYPTVWLGDTLGDMPLFYGLADVALLGGSFEPLGGQNLIEAAACGCPVVMGPHTFNFAEAAELSQAAGAALRVTGLRQGAVAATGLASDANALNAAREAARGFASANQGATARHVVAILDLLKGAKVPLADALAATHV